MSKVRQSEVPGSDPQATIYISTQVQERVGYVCHIFIVCVSSVMHQSRLVLGRVHLARRGDWALNFDRLVQCHLNSEEIYCL